MAADPPALPRPPPHLTSHQVAFYGHDHNLEHIKYTSGTQGYHSIVSGAGSGAGAGSARSRPVAARNRRLLLLLPRLAHARPRLLCLPSSPRAGGFIAAPTANSLYRYANQGFVAVTVTDETMTVDFHTVVGGANTPAYTASVARVWA